MDQHRLGTCSSCEAQYRVPATFKADKAKCKKCGGVVEIGPVVGEAPAAKPAPAKQPRAARPAQGSKSASGSGSSRSSRSSGAKAKRKPAPAAAAPAEKPAQGESVRSATEDAATRVRSSGGKGKSSRSSSKRKGRKSKKKDSKLGLVLGIVALLLIAGGGGWFLMNKDKSVEAQDTETVATAGDSATENTPDAPGATGATGATGAQGAEAAATEAGGETPENTGSTGAAGAEAPAAGSSTPDATEEAGDVDAEDAPDQETEPEPVKPEINLAELEDFGAAPGTSDEEWEELQALVATAIDPNAGARGNRAANTLTEKGRIAIPAVLNTIKTLELGTKDGYRDGDLLQKLLERICNGNNYGWKYSTDEADVVFNEKVVVAWFKSWDRVVGEGADGTVWIKLGNLDAEQTAAYRAEMGLEGEPAPEVGSAEELEDF